MNGWRAVKSTGFSSRKPELNSQHSHGGSQPSVTPVSGDMTLLRAFKGIGHVHDTQTYMQAKHSHTKIKSSLSKKMEDLSLYYKETIR